MISGFNDMNSWGNMPTQNNYPATMGFASDFMNKSPVLNSGNMGLSDWMAQTDGGGTSIMDSLRKSGFLGSDGNQGWGGMALGALGSLGGAFMGMQNYNLARDTLKSSQDQFAKNYAAQRTVLNSQMEDRQRARVSANANNESVDSYMNRNRVQ